MQKICLTKFHNQIKIVRAKKHSEIFYLKPFGINQNNANMNSEIYVINSKSKIVT